MTNLLIIVGVILALFLLHKKGFNPAGWLAVLAIWLMKYSVVAVVVIAAPPFVGQAFAACPAGDWTWDPIARRSCAPCDFTITDYSAHKTHDRCTANAGGGSTGGAATRIVATWPAFTLAANKTFDADRYDIEVSVNNGGWTSAGIVYNAATEMIISDSIDWPAGKLCVRYRAGDYQQWSNYSDTKCADIPNQGGGQTGGSRSAKPDALTISVD